MKKDEAFAFWKESSDKDWDTALYLFEGKRYDSALFFCRLSIEKLLKGIVHWETESVSPYTHNLLYLAKKTSLPLSNKQKEHLHIITSFNIAARYEDDKKAFYKKCTRKYTQNHIKEIELMRLWLQENSPHQ
jgi:HEPN domain-containing protein